MCGPKRLNVPALENSCHQMYANLSQAGTVFGQTLRINPT